MLMSAWGFLLLGCLGGFVCFFSCVFHPLLYVNVRGFIQGVLELASLGRIEKKMAAHEGGSEGNKAISH